MESRPGVPGVIDFQCSHKLGHQWEEGYKFSGWIVGEAWAWPERKPFIFVGERKYRLRMYAPRLGLRIQETFKLHL